ncbi:branched-chain amino acid ABC transporter permease [bacterium]|nr:MAG: branched-chain amino acid ABC transporter permease [bacterium]
MLHDYALLIVTGLLWGGVYLLMAEGLNLIYGVMKVVNLAHGDFIVAGGLVAFSLFAAYHLSPIVAFPVAALLLFAVGLAVQSGILERLAARGGNAELRTLLATFGLSYIVSNLALLLWGGQVQSLPFLQSSIAIGDLPIPENLLVCSIVACLLAGAVHFWLTKTVSGKALRATSQSELGAASCGLNIRMIRIVSFAMGSAMAGAAGALTIPLIPFQASSGSYLTVQAFTVIALGGLGNYVGAVLAAATLGLAEAFASFFLGSNAAAAVVYLLFIAVLIFRPQGLLGKAGRV